MTAAANHPKAYVQSGDIRAIRREQVSRAIGLQREEVDLIIGGPPCQGFSSIRPFRSATEDDPRNSLFEEFASFVNFFRPRMFIIENVVGLATHKGGLTLEAMQECFARIGYATDWRILNAAHYGIPQKRERLIFMGARDGGKIGFPPPTHFCDAPTIGHSDPRKVIKPQRQATLFQDAPVLEDAVSVMEAISDLPPIASGEEAVQYIDPPKTRFQEARRRRAESLTLHGSTKHTSKMLEIIRYSGPNIKSIPRHLISSGFSSCYSRLDADKPSTTITVNFVHPASNRCIHPILDRALTPREGARLQSFDDDYVFKGSRSQIVKQIGNAVPPLLGTALADHVAAFL